MNLNKKSIAPVRVLESKNDISKSPKRPKIVLLILVLLFVSTPILLSLILTKTWLSSYILGTFLGELLISILLVIYFVIFSRTLDFVVSKLTPYILIPSYNEMLRVSDVNSISNEEMSSAQLLQSLKKWIWQENNAGWFEIQEITQGKKLSDLSAVLMVKQELYRVQQDTLQTSSVSRNHGYSAKLKSLLVPSEIRTLNQVILDFDEGNASEEDVKSTMVVNNFAKWTCKGDETGWVAIGEIREDQRSLLATLAKLELWRLEEKVQKSKFITKVNRRKLESLLMA